MSCLPEGVGRKSKVGGVCEGGKQDIPITLIGLETGVLFEARISGRQPVRLTLRPTEKRPYKLRKLPISFPLQIKIDKSYKTRRLQTFKQKNRKNCRQDNKERFHMRPHVLWGKEFKLKHCRLHIYKFRHSNER